eukprot:10152032-Alexandrium_andersonii.AAC.1
MLATLSHLSARAWSSQDVKLWTVYGGTMLRDAHTVVACTAGGQISASSRESAGGEPQRMLTRWCKASEENGGLLNH